MFLNQKTGILKRCTFCEMVLHDNPILKYHIIPESVGFVKLIETRPTSPRAFPLPKNPKIFNVKILHAKITS